MPLYAFMLAWPGEPQAVVKSLATNSPQVAGRKITDVPPVGHPGIVQWTPDEQGPTVHLREQAPNGYAVALKIKGI